jgi:hypothetical protein
MRASWFIYRFNQSCSALLLLRPKIFPSCVFLVRFGTKAAGTYSSVVFSVTLAAFVWVAMPHQKKEQPTAENIAGLKYFDKLMPMLHKLHDVGTERDKAGNRKLHFDHYCAYILLFLFNPIITSLRSIQKASAASILEVSRCWVRRPHCLKRSRISWLHGCSCISKLADAITIPMIRNTIDPVQSFR